MSGQFQYGSAQRLTPSATRGRRPPTADPARFPTPPAASRSVALLGGCCTLLAVLLTAAPLEVPGMAVSVVLGGLWLSLVLAMTLPRESERAGRELVRRLAQFRHELNAIGDAPSRAALERMIRRAAELGLTDEEVSDELSELRACLEALDVKERVARGDLPLVQPPDPLTPGDACHFVCPVRFGRRRADHFGQLVLTSGWLKFRGALDLSIPWSEVAAVRRDGRDIVAWLQDSRRVLRFCCYSLGEAARGGVVAEHLTKAARLATRPVPTGCDLTL